MRGCLSWFCSTPVLLLHAGAPARKACSDNQIFSIPTGSCFATLLVCVSATSKKAGCNAHLLSCEPDASVRLLHKYIPGPASSRASHKRFLVCAGFDCCGCGSPAMLVA